MLLLYKLSIFVLQKRKNKFTALTQIINNEDIIVATTPRVYEVIRRLTKKERPQIWLTVPWVQASISIEDQELKLFNLVTYSDLFWSIKMSWLGASEFSKKSNFTEDCLQTYTAPDWFLVWVVFEKINVHVKKWWIANHQDRWAVLIDGVQGNEEKTMVVQHGKFVQNFKFPYLLKNIYKIYCFNQSEYKLFCQNYIIHTCIPIWQNLPSKIDLQPIIIPSNKEYSILIISQPVSIQKEIEVTLSLLEHFSGISIYYKPHPLFLNSMNFYLDNIKKTSNETINMINDKSFYPKVDIAITYNSTLGLEYEASGISVVWLDKISLKQATEIIKLKLNL